MKIGDYVIVVKYDRGFLRLVNSFVKKGFVINYGMESIIRLIFKLGDMKF